MSRIGLEIETWHASCRSHRHDLQEKLWGQMTALERLQSKRDYLSYNYGHDHPLAVSARAGDIDAFRHHARDITELMDAAVVALRRLVGA